MNLFTSAKTTYFIVFGAILFQAGFYNPAFGQRTDGTGTSSPVTSQGIAGSDVQSSEIRSLSSQMPRFAGFNRLDQTAYIGSNVYHPQRLSTGQTLPSGQQASSGNTRAMTTGSRTTRNAMSNRNMTTMNMGRGGVGTNTNTVRSVTSLGYSFNETLETIRQPEAIRMSQIENRINNNSRITAIVPITVEMENSTAILRGVVKNEHERRLLEQLVKLEPGIYRVQNELTLPME